MDVSEGGRPSGIWHRYLSEVRATSIFNAVKYNFCHAIPALTRTYVSDCTAIITVARFSNLTDYEAATSTREKPNYTANCPQYSLTVDACVSPVLLQQFSLFLLVHLFNFSLLFILRAFFCENRLENNITARIMWRIISIHGLGRGNLSPNITNGFQLWRNLGGTKLKDRCEVQIVVTRWIVTRDTDCRQLAVHKLVANCCKFPCCCAQCKNYWDTTSSLEF